jgi:hypothetical protein|tara:strand:+ start:621 stop:809 length:189 start_codon:yes stop_codon:yes gene_type:complete
MAYTKVKNLKVGDIYFDKGLTVNGDLINTECKVISYNGMNKYVVENDGITILVDGEDVVSTK